MQDCLADGVSWKVNLEFVNCRQSAGRGVLCPSELVSICIESMLGSSYFLRYGPTCKLY